MARLFALAVELRCLFPLEEIGAGGAGGSGSRRVVTPTSPNNLNSMLPVVAGAIGLKSRALHSFSCR